MNNKPGTASSPPVSKPQVKYDSRFIAEVDVYKALCVEKKETPSPKGFADHIGVDLETIEAWANKKLKDQQGNPTKDFARLDFLRAVKSLLVPPPPSAPEQKKEKAKEGRPPKYGPEILKKAENYIKESVDELASVKESENPKTGRVRYQTQFVVKLPKAEGLALCLGVRRETLYAWAKEYPEFSNILERINQIQADRVINQALAGNYNPLIAKLLLGKHGYKEESKQELSGEVKNIWKEEEPK